MTVAELKTKIHTEFEIPTNVQRWIIGKNLVNRDDVTLNELHAMDGLPVFLYLVAPGNLIHSIYGFYSDSTKYLYSFVLPYKTRCKIEVYWFV